MSSQITLLASMNAEMKSLWPDEVRLKIRPERLEVESCKADGGVQLVAMESVGNEIQFDSGARRCSPNCNMNSCRCDLSKPFHTSCTSYFIARNLNHRPASNSIVQGVCSADDCTETQPQHPFAFDNTINDTPWHTDVIDGIRYYARPHH